MERQDPLGKPGSHKTLSVAKNAIKSLSQSKKYGKLQIPSLNMEIISLLHHNEEEIEEKAQNEEEKDQLINEKKASIHSKLRKSGYEADLEPSSGTHNNINKRPNCYDTLLTLKGEENVRNDLNKAILCDLVASKLKQYLPEQLESDSSPFSIKIEEEGSPMHKSKRLVELKKEKMFKIKEEQEKLRKQAKTLTGETIAKFKIFQNMFTNSPNLLDSETVLKKLKNEVKPVKSLFTAYKTTDEFPMQRIAIGLVSEEQQMRSCYEEAEQSTSRKLSSLHHLNTRIKEKQELMKKSQDLFEKALEHLQDGEDGLNEAKHMLAANAKFDRRGAVRDVQNLKAFMRLNGLENKRNVMKAKLDEETKKIKKDVEELHKEVKRVEKELNDIRSSKMLFKSKLKHIYSQMLNIDRAHPELVGRPVIGLKHPKEIVLALWEFKEDLIYDSFPRFLDPGNVDYLFKVARLEKDIKTIKGQVQTPLNRLHGLANTERNGKMLTLNLEDSSIENNQKRKAGMGFAAVRLAELKHESIQSFKLISSRNPKTGAVLSRWEQVGGTVSEKSSINAKGSKDESSIPTGGFRFKTQGNPMNFERSKEFSDSHENQEENEKSFFIERHRLSADNILNDTSGMYKITERIEKETKREVKRVFKKFQGKDDDEKTFQELRRIFLYILPFPTATKTLEDYEKSLQVHFNLKNTFNLGLYLI